MENFEMNSEQLRNLYGPATEKASAKIMKSLEPHSICLLYTSPSPRDVEESRMPSSA